MFTTQTMARRQAMRGRRGRWLAVPACALALLMLAGNATAMPLERDDVLYAHRIDRAPGSVAAADWLHFKLATTAGYYILVFG